MPTREPLSHSWSACMQGRTALTALIWAVRLEHFDLVKLLLESGADPNIVTDVVEGTNHQVVPLCWMVT